MTARNSRRGPDAEPAPLPETGRLTAVTPQVRNPQRVSLFVDGEFVLGVAAEVAAELGLRPGRIVDRPLLERARALDEGARAREDAVAFLALKPRTRQEVERRLARRGYSPEAAAAAIAYLAARGWMDDTEYARMYVRQRLEGRDPHGGRRLSADLRRRGVSPEIIAAVLAEALGPADPVAPAVALAERRLTRTRFPNRQAAYRRLGGYLARRGYDAQTIALALRQVLGRDAEEESDL